MSARMRRSRLRVVQRGLSFVEVLLSIIILGIAILPALDSIRSGIQSATTHEELIVDHYSLLSKMQEVKNLPFENLLEAASSAGSNNIPSVYSDAVGVEPRHIVYLSYYDVEDSDSDANHFTLLDTNTDGDSNPYTNASTEAPLSLLWISVEIEFTSNSLQTLVLR